jgi:hypothetical protein
MAYAGQLYEGKRDPNPLLEVLRDLFREPVLRPCELWLPTLVSRYGLEEVVELNDVVGRGEALHREMEPQILLLLGWSDAKETGQHTGKLFGYLGAGRPILPVGRSRGVLADVLDKT